MHSAESRREELRGGAFAWIPPLLLVVLILVLSWTGLFVVVSDLVDAASKAALTTEAVHE